MTTAEASGKLTHEAEELQRRERELSEREAAFAVVRGSVNAMIADLLRGQERLHADAGCCSESWPARLKR
jgi:hypothetical protein